MKQLFIYAIIIHLITSCNRQSKIDYENKIDTTSIVDDRINDTTKVLISDLPIKFDSTDVLIFAIHLVTLQERGGYHQLKSASYGSSDFGSGYFNQDYLIGNFINLVFKGKDGPERKLTDNKIEIKKVEFLREVFNSTKSGYLLYLVFDRDTNGDGQLNSSDLESLYISKINGTQFKKLTKELHQFYDYEQIKGENRIFFRSLEDVNKDGELNKNDKVHYYQIEFSRDDYVISEINPIKTFE